MIVRLKGKSIRSSTYAGMEFQFYDSPIKSARQTAYEGQVVAFQFYDSPIKRHT